MEMGQNGYGGLSYQSVDSYGGGYERIYRVRAEAVEGLAEGKAGPSDSDGIISGAIQSVIDGITGFFGELTNENEVFPEGTALSDEEYNKLYYKGIAPLKGSQHT